jgi:hypothetical protein
MKFLLIIFLLYPHQTLATKTKFSTTVDLGFSIIDFSYKEFKKDGQLFNHEYGTLPGLKIGMMKHFKPGFLSATLSYHLNDVNYQGETQAGKPLKTRTDQKIFDFSFQLGRQLKNTHHFIFQVYTGLGYHQWQRDILSTSTVSGLFETYQWWYGLLGIKGILPVSEQSKLSMNLSVIYPINPTIQVDFHGIFDEKTFDLAGQWGRRFSLAWQYQYSEKMNLVIEPYLEQQHFGQSARQTLTRRGKIVGSLFEPRSKMHNYGLMIYLRRAF